MRRSDARKLLEKAVAIDPTFAAAWLVLSQAAGALDDRSAEAAYRQKVFEHIARLSERERWLFEAAEAGLEGKDQQAIEILEKLIARHPDEEAAYNTLAGRYQATGNAEQSMAAIERGVKALPKSGALRNANGYGLLNSGRYPAALREFETYAQLEPNEPNPFDSQAEVYLLMGQPQQALERYAHALEIDPLLHDLAPGARLGVRDAGRLRCGHRRVAASGESHPRERGGNERQRFLHCIFPCANRALPRSRRPHSARHVRRGHVQGSEVEILLLALLRSFIDIERDDLSAALDAAGLAHEIMNHFPAGLQRAWSATMSLVSGVIEARAG